MKVFWHCPDILDFFGQKKNKFTIFIFYFLFFVYFMYYLFMQLFIYFVVFNIFQDGTNLEQLRSRKSTIFI